MTNKHTIVDMAEDLRRQALALLDAGRLPDPVIPPRPRIQESETGVFELHFCLENPLGCR